MIDNKSTIAYLIQYSEQSGISLEDLLSLYLVCKEDLFFVLDTFSGKRIKFPKVELDLSGSLKFIEVNPKTLYPLVSGENREARNLLVGDLFYRRDQCYEVTHSLVEVLGRNYLIVMEANNGTSSNTSA